MFYFFLYDEHKREAVFITPWKQNKTGFSVNNKKLVINRLHQLMIESGQSDKNFKNTLSKITGKTPRTIRRWYSLENNIHESDIETIAKHFGKHAHWLRYGDRKKFSTAVDQIMSSDHFGAVILKNRQVEEINFKLVEMMNLSDKEIYQTNICDFLFQSQTNETIAQCKISHNEANDHGAHVDQIIMVLGDKKRHFIEMTTLNLDNGRILRILFDKGLADSVDHDNSKFISTNKKNNNSALNILFVDDDMANCRLYYSMLSIHNCYVNIYTNSTEALNEFKQNHKHYDLIIADVIMPEMTGDILAEECLKIRADIPVILCSGYADHLNKSTAEEFGVSHYLQKPIDSALLLSIIEEISQPLALS